MTHLSFICSGGSVRRSPPAKMQEIMRDYLYIKNYLRNMFNHASEENDRSEE